LIFDCIPSVGAAQREVTDRQQRRPHAESMLFGKGAHIDHCRVLAPVAGIAAHYVWV
jgi:hypothetical protein